MVRSFEFGENENPNFIDMALLEEENPAAAVAEDDEEVPATVEKEGVYIKGRDVIVLDAPAIRFPQNAPLETDKRELYEILNELFGEGGGGGDEEWQPPDWWIDVPEPNEYEIYILVWVTSVSYNTFSVSFRNGKTDKSDFGGAYCDWGDGTFSSYPVDYWNGKVSHKFTETGQYLVKIVVSEDLNVLRFAEERGCFWQIVKTGSGILFFAALEELGAIYGNPLANHSRLKYIQINNEKGLPFYKINSYFENDYALKKIVLKKAMTGNIPEGCFEYNSFTDTEQISLDNKSVASVGKNAFHDCHSLKKIILPNCTSVGDYAFQGCYNLQEIVVAEDCVFGTNCFQNCYSLYPRPDGSTN